MTLDQLRVFVGVAEYGHMTRAADALHMTQSAASAAVAALEARHGVLLFDRIGRGLALSPAGVEFLPEARAILLRTEAASQVLDDLAGLRRGAVRIAASQTVSSYWLPQRMARFALAHPAIRLSLSVANTSQVAQAVLEGGADLGFVEGEIDLVNLTRGVVATDRIALYAAPSQADRPAPTPEALQAAPWIMRERGSGTRSALEAALARAGLDPRKLRIVLELPSNEAVLAALEGELVAGVSQFAAEPSVSAGRLTCLNVDLGWRNFDLLLHKDRRNSRAAAAFIAELEPLEAPEPSPLPQ
jgi:DNA-binding transcriptional LysR family regulator